MKKLFTFLALTISFSMNAQMDDNSANNNTVLINAIKEQEDKISRLENLVEQLIKE